MRKVVICLSAVTLLLAGFLMGHFVSTILATNGVPSSVPPYIHYQGMLLDPATQNPVPDDTYSITFTIYDASTEGNQIWQETQDVAVNAGLFSVLLGSVTDLTTTVFAEKERYLGIQVGTDPEMTPRQRLASVPYAYQAENAQYALHAGQSDNATTAMTLQGDTPSSFLKHNPLQIALLRWYQANQSGSRFDSGYSPGGIAFDGDHMWVANNGSDTVTKIRASDGAVMGTYDVGTAPRGVAFDGANIWVTNYESNNVTKLRASDGTVLGTFAVGTDPFGVVFDGANIWVTNNLSDNVTKLRASDGTVLGTYAVDTAPSGVAFDGANIWVANFTFGTVTKLRASDGTVLGTYPVGLQGSARGAYGVAFDGANIWVTTHLDDRVTKLRASDGFQLGIYTVGDGPYGIAFDGVNIWVANYFSNNVTKLRASDGVVLGTYAVGSGGVNGAVGVAFDGANIWVTSIDGRVYKL